MPAWVLAALLTLAAGCASPGVGPGPMRAPDFRPTQIRHPAVVVRIALGPGVLDEQDRPALVRAYEAVLLDEFNARAVLLRDLRIETAGPLDAPAALARARAAGADHAILIDVRVERRDLTFCRGARRPFRATVTLWSQRVEVLRARDGARRLAAGDGDTLAVIDLLADCDDPRASRRRTREETLGEAVSRLLTRLLGS